MTYQRIMFLALAGGAMLTPDRVPATSSNADDAPKSEQLRQTIVRDQEALSRRFRDTRVDILRAAQRLDRGTDTADRAHAAALRKALQSFQDSGVDARFDKGIAAIKAPATLGLADVNQALEQLEPLPEKLRDVLENLATDRADLPALLNARSAYLVRLQGELQDGIARLSQSIEAKPGKKADETDNRTGAGLSGLAGQIEREVHRLAQLTDRLAKDSPHRDLLRETETDTARLRDRIAKLDAGTATRALAGEVGNRLKRVQGDARKEVDRLTGGVRKAKDDPDGLPEYGELITMLSDVESEQREVLKRLRRLATVLEEEQLK
jgi:hypothetical protein